MNTTDRRVNSIIREMIDDQRTGSNVVSTEVIAATKKLLRNKTVRVSNSIVDEVIDLVGDIGNVTKRFDGFENCGSDAVYIVSLYQDEFGHRAAIRLVLSLDEIADIKE
jgi:hypothetical protein